MFDGNWLLGEYEVKILRNVIFCIVFFMGLIGCVIGFLANKGHDKDCPYKKEAIERGFALYKVDKDGKVTFEWLSKQ